MHRTLMAFVALAALIAIPTTQPWDAGPLWFYASAAIEGLAVVLFGALVLDELF